MDEAIFRITKEALILILVTAGPIVAIALVVGLITSFFQAATQMQEQNISFVPKWIAVFVALLVIGPWIISQWVRFTTKLLMAFPTLVK